MNKRYGRISFLWAIPGLILANGVAILLRVLAEQRTYADSRWLPWVTLACSVVGIILLTVGCAYYARAKGRHPAWGMFGILGIVGLIVLACLRDRAKEYESAEQPSESSVAKHSGRGVASVVLFGIACTSFALVLVFDAVARGASRQNIETFLGVGGLVAALVGFGYGIAAIVQRNRRRLFAVLGLALNGAFFLLLVLAGVIACLLH